MKKKRNDYEYDDLLNRCGYFEYLYEMGFRYIARSQSGELRVFKEKPKKEINFWSNGLYDTEHVLTVDPSLVNDLSWNDAEPPKLKKIIKSIEAQLNKEG